MKQVYLNGMIIITKRDKNLIKIDMKKIMFNDKYSLTQAVLDGRKTMTRRALTDRKLHYWKYSCPDMVIVKVPESNKIKPGDDNTYFGIKEKISDGYYCDTIVSPYKVGEVVAIAQSYKDSSYDPNALDRDPKDLGIRGFMRDSAGWNNKMFVKSYACKHHIKITNVKVERLQDISEEDCEKEGIQYLGLEYEHYGDPMYSFEGSDTYYTCAKDAFSRLIDKVSGKGTWERNPFVWVYEFVLWD